MISQYSLLFCGLMFLRMMLFKTQLSNQTKKSTFVTRIYEKSKAKPHRFKFDNQTVWLQRTQGNFNFPLIITSFWNKPILGSS